MNIRRLQACILVSVFLGSSSWGAFYSVTATALVQGAGRDEQGSSGPNPVTTQAKFTSQGSTAQGAASAEPGVAKVAGNAVARPFRSTGAGTATATWSDVLFTNVDGTEETLNTTLNFNATGSSIFQNGLNRSAVWTYTVRVTQGGFDTLISQNINFSQGTGLAGLDNQVLHLNGLKTGLKTTITFDMLASCTTSDSGGSGPSSINVSAVLSPGHISDFPSGGRTVFDLPAGITANSAEMNIVNNLWQPVPEPSTLMALGVVCLGALRSRRLRTNA